MLNGGNGWLRRKVRELWSGPAWSPSALSLDPEGFDPEELPSAEELSELSDQAYQELLDRLPSDGDGDGEARF